MKKHIIPIILVAILAIVNIGMAVYVYGIFSAPEDKVLDSNVVQMTAPEQAEPLTLEKETVKDFEPVTPEGVNVALKGKTSSGSNQDVYLPNKAVDGDTKGPSYWEGAAGVWPNWISVDFGDVYPVYCAKISLCPAAVWSKRTQEFSISVSTDGENYTEVSPSTVHQFDPLYGNYVIVEFDEVEAKSIKVEFKSNSGATGPQVAELEVYSMIKK